jgi:hypothetical protein
MTRRARCWRQPPRGVDDRRRVAAGGRIDRSVSLVHTTPSKSLGSRTAIHMSSSSIQTARALLCARQGCEGPRIPWGLPGGEQVGAPRQGPETRTQGQPDSTVELHKRDGDAGCDLGQDADQDCSHAGRLVPTASACERASITSSANPVGVRAPPCQALTWGVHASGSARTAGGRPPRAPAAIRSPSATFSDPHTTAACAGWVRSRLPTSITTSRIAETRATAGLERTAHRARSAVRHDRATRGRSGRRVGALISSPVLILG